MNSFLTVFFFLSFFVSAALAQETVFYFTSNPGSYVGQGKTVTAEEPEWKVTFDTMFVGSQWGPIEVLVVNVVKKSNSQQYWSFTIGSAPNEELEVGDFYGTRAGGQDIGMLNFVGEGRGNNITEGWFSILEYDRVGDHYALEFIQFDEANENKWEYAIFLGNSLEYTIVETPEPQRSLLILLGVGLIVLKRRR